jgi:hypothetical protein
LFPRISPSATQEDLEFIRAWLRGQYAESLRSKTKGSGNEDFEKIGTRFHTWVKDNAKKIGLKTPDAFYFFVKSDMQFYASVYFKIINATNGDVKQLENLYLSSHWNIATSLELPLMMASISKLDDEITINEKLLMVSRFIDIYTVYRTFDGSPITQSAIRYFIYMLVKEIRNKSVSELSEILRRELSKMGENLTRLDAFDANSANNKFLRYIFARVVYHIETVYRGNKVSFQDIIAMRKKKRYVVVPLIIPDSFESYSDRFTNKSEYSAACAQLGNYVYVPNPIKETMEDIIDERKLTYLQHENYFSSSVFRTQDISVDDRFGFNSIERLTSKAIEKRTSSVAALITEIWNPELLRVSARPGN